MSNITESPNFKQIDLIDINPIHSHLSTRNDARAPLVRIKEAVPSLVRKIGTIRRVDPDSALLMAAQLAGTDEITSDIVTARKRVLEAQGEPVPHYDVHSGFRLCQGDVFDSRTPHLTSMLQKK